MISFLSLRTGHPYPHEIQLLLLSVWVNSKAIVPNEHIGNRTHDFLAVPQPTAPPRNAVFQTSLAKSNMSGYRSHCSTIFLSYFCSGCGMMANRVQKRRQLLNFCIKVMTKQWRSKIWRRSNNFCNVFPLLTCSMEQSPSWEGNFSAFYGTTRKFITVLTSARHLSLSWKNSIQSPQPLLTPWRSILILFSHLFFCNHRKNWTLWGNRFGKGYRSVLRQTWQLMEMCCPLRTPLIVKKGTDTEVPKRGRKG